MANANKNKGKALEREVSKELTSIFNLNFQRVFGSGAFVGGKNAFRVSTLSREQNLAVCGDIMVPIELEHIAFECKFYKSFAFSSLFDNNEQLNDWIEQSKVSNKCWFIILKVNNNGKFVVFDRKNESTFVTNSCKMIYKNEYVICRYDGFFECNKDILLSMKPKEQNGI
jgi:hypothetical protein